MAQEESRHISENVTWTFQKKMKEGKPFVSNNLLGLRLNEAGDQLEVIPEEAEIVKLIFDLYDSGLGTSKIKDELTKRGIRGVHGAYRWHDTTISSMLRNEKYVGDLLLQKGYTVDYLTHKRVKNRGQRTQYFIQDAHEAIITREQWDRVQEKLNHHSTIAVGKNRDLNKYNSIYPLTGTLICLECGKPFKRRTWMGGSRKTIKHLYQCNGYINKSVNGERCCSRPVSEVLTLKACCDVIKTIYLKDSKIFDKVAAILEKTLGKDSITKEITEKASLKENIGKEIDDLLARRPLVETLEEKKEIDSKYTTLVDRYKKLDNEILVLKDREKRVVSSQERLKKMTEVLKKKELTPDMLTKEMLDIFIYRIIAVDDRNLVFVINSTNSVTIEDLVRQRFEIAERQPIYKNSFKDYDPIKYVHLKYKVVLV